MNLGDGFASIFAHFFVEALPPASVDVNRVHGDFQKLLCVHFEFPSDFLGDLDAVSLLQPGSKPDFFGERQHAKPLTGTDAMRRPVTFTDAICKIVKLCLKESAQNCLF